MAIRKDLPGKGTARNPSLKPPGCSGRGFSSHTKTEVGKKRGISRSDKSPTAGNTSCAGGGTSTRVKFSEGKASPAN